MPTALHVTVLELRRRLRDRSGLLAALVAPAVLAVIVSAAFGGGGGFHAEVAVSAPEEGQIAEAYTEGLLAALVDDELIDLTSGQGATAVTEAVTDGRADVGVIVPDGLDAAFADGGQATIEVVRRADREVAGDTLEALTTSFLAEVGRLQGAVADAGLTEPPKGLTDLDPAEVADDPEAALAALPEDVVALATPAVELVDVDAGGEAFGAASYFGPSMALLFVFFTLSAAPRSLLAERRGGQLARVLASPAPAWAAPVGKTLASMLLGFVSISIVWGVSVTLFDVRWGDPGPVLALIAVTILAVGGLTALVTAFARTPSQADGYAAMLAFGLAIVGGHFIMLHELPETLRTLALATPNGWALRAFTDLAADGAGLADIALPLAVIAGFAVASTALAVPLLQRRLTA